MRFLVSAGLRMQYITTVSPTFDLYILVPDIEIAANTLRKKGWTTDNKSLAKIGNAEVDLPTQVSLSS
jgi:hypothetical protein